MIPRPCQWCNTIFDAKNNSPSRKFCSRECYAKASRKTVLLICDQCGKLFAARQVEARRGARFCSRACWREGMESPALRDDVRDKISAAKTKGQPRDVRRRQLQHAGMTVEAKGETCCRNCGSTGGRLQVHHIFPRSMWQAGKYEPRNGVVLCVRCHMGWHHRVVTISRTIFTEEEWAFLSGVELLGQSTEAWLDDRYPPAQDDARDRTGTSGQAGAGK